MKQDKNLPLKKNDKIILDIIDITTDGNGVGKVYSEGNENGYAVFVPGSAVGDKLEVLILKTLKNYCFGKILNIISPSEKREENTCPVYSKCGGCSFRHIKYEEELRLKGEFVKNNMKKIGGIDAEVGNALASPKVNGYRNKALYPVRKEDGKVVIGFFARHSHRVIPCENCFLHPSFYENILEAVKSYIEENSVSCYDEETGKGLVRHIFIRHGENSGEIMVCLVINGKQLPNEKDLVNKVLLANENVKSIVLNFNTKKTNVIMGEKCRKLYGEEYISDTLCGVKFRISPLSFYQINHDQTENLYGIAKEFLNPQKDETIIDLYCGAGTIGLSMAKDVKSLIGVEIVEEAIADAKLNAKINGIENAQFICADASKAAKDLAEKNTTPDGIVVDPPRKGLSLDVIDAMVKMNPKRIVMVSCNSSSCARDCKLLEERGYKVKEVRAVDMFPRTEHVETVVLLTK